MPSNWQEQRVECTGGLEATKNHLLMSTVAPGVATTLVNYEVSPSGGYARLLGYEQYNSDYPEVGVGVCEGAVIGIFYYVDSTGQDIYYAARKDTSGATYSIWQYVDGAAWSKITTLPSTRSTSSGGRNIVRLRWKLYNDGSNNYVIIVDGVNPALIYDGTTWLDMDSAGAGSTADPGGGQIIDYPNYIAVFNRHLFLGRGDAGESSIVCHSAPDKPYDFTSANGAGQVLPGFSVEQIYPFREQLYIFGENEIGAVTVNGTDFVYKDVASDVGCAAPDTVHEMGSSVVFLSADGFRPIAGTDRIGDVEIAPITESVRPLLKQIVTTYGKDSMNSIMIHTKNQMRMSYGGAADGTENTEFGFIMGTRLRREGGFQFECGQTYQINFWCGFSEVVDGRELTLHGGYDGIVYKQEVGNTFDGAAIFSSFAGPYLDQGSVSRRKAYKNIYWFMRLDFSAGSSSDQTFYMSTKFDWDGEDLVLPPDYTMGTGEGAVEYDMGYTYDSGIVYGGNNPAILEQNIEGSGFSMRPGLVTNTVTPRHVVFGYVIVYEGEGVN